VDKCRYGLDKAHEELQRINAIREPTPEDKRYRAVLKETLFFCHYERVSCGWGPPKSLQPIYDTLRWEFLLCGRTLPEAGAPMSGGLKFLEGVSLG